MSWLILQSTLFLVAAGLTALAMGPFRKLALRKEILDKPHAEHHKNHTTPTPVIGGVAMATVWLALLLAGLAAAAFLPKTLFPAQIRDALGGLPAAARSLAVITLCATGLAAMGFRDDTKPLSARTKLLFQLAAATLTALFGPRILVGIAPLWLSWAITILWIATVANAINFFDNMNGLAGGTALIAFAFLFAIAALRGQLFVGTLTALSAGVTLGFLFYNFPKAAVFMGDCGSHFLGYLLAVATIMTTFYHHENTPSILALAIPVMVLAVPLLDAVTVVLLRLKQHKPIYVGDNQHISHRFAALGLSRPKAVAAVWLLAALAGAGALSLIWTPPAAAWLILAQMTAMVALVLLIQLGAHPPEK